MLSKKVPLLESKISNLETVNSNWIKVDSLRSNQLSLYKEVIASKEEDINKLNKSLRTNKYITGSSVLATIILAIVCIFK